VYTELTKITDETGIGWVLYDAECRFCVALARRWERPLARRQFRLAPLQTDGVRAGLEGREELLREMRVVTAQGRVFGGAAAVVELARHFWWAAWLGLVANLPLGKRALDAAYRWIAERRHCLGGACSVKASGGREQATESDHRREILGEGSQPVWLRDCGRVARRTESVFEKWVARATRPFRSATRRPERARLSPAEGSPYSLPMRSPFRPASRRTAQASGLCYPKRNFQTRSEAGEVARPTTAGAGGVACPTNGGKRIRWWNALPLLGLPVVATLATWRAPAWLLMWSVAFALFAGIKWLMWRDANATPAGVGRTLGFLTLWPGMHARRFLAPAMGQAPPALREWLGAAFKTVLGAALVWGMARVALGLFPLAAGWAGMIGVVVFLHFGLFHFVSLAWRSAGVDAPPIMRAPLRATSLSDFWGRRWNLGFSVPARRLLLKPIAARLGQGAATMIVFLVSGLLHELVLSVPARAGYGLPTAYFLAQGAAILFERSALGRRIGLGDGWRGRAFALLLTAGPAYWLFNSTFVHRVILPFLQAIGAI